MNLVYKITKTDFAQTHCTISVT